MDFFNFVKESKALRGSGVRGRYAPSPSGALHLGNLQTALLAWLHARLADGVLILRIEDLDQARVVDGSAERMMEDLAWLGLDWDEGPSGFGGVCDGPCAPYIQSERLFIYDEIFQRFQEDGVVYPCYCSRREIREAVRAPHGGTPVYPGFCRRLWESRSQPHPPISPEKKEPSWRYIVPDAIVSFHDGVAGDVSESLLEDVGDFVIRRADGCYAYQFAVAVDDYLMGITDVVRGADLLSSTCRQIVLYEHFARNSVERQFSGRFSGERSLTPTPMAPRYWHTPLALDPEGRRLCKRDGAASVDFFKKKGYLAEDVVAMIFAQLGVEGDFHCTPKELLKSLLDSE